MSDNLEHAARLVVSRPTSQHDRQLATALALIDIGQSLRDIAEWCNNSSYYVRD